MKRAAIIGLAALFMTGPSNLLADVKSASFSEPTSRYTHGVLGDSIEFGAIVLGVGTSEIQFTLPIDHVFEDLEPRLIDVDGDQDFEVVVVETDMRLGAALAIYDETGKLAETPHIGRSHRWLAPIGGADLDGDGHIELSYIDRPHLAKTLRVWRYRNGSLEPVSDLPGLTNHRIGEDFISAGIRDCGEGPEIITANANWSRVMATQLRNGQLESREIGEFKARESLTRALDCK
jgi:hypothetical protein